GQPLSAGRSEISPDGKRLLYTKDLDVVCREVGAERPLRSWRVQPPGEYVSRLLFAGDSRTAYIAVGKNIHEWDVETGQVRRTLEAEQRTIRLAVSPDGKTLLAVTGVSRPGEKW